MNTRLHIGWVGVLVAAGVVIICSSCATQRITPPLFTSAPQQEPLGSLKLLPVPKAPEVVSIPLTIRIPHCTTSVNEKNGVMRRGAFVRACSSVVISAPASIYQRSQESPGVEISDTIGFKTEGYFNLLEQYIERGLIYAGFYVKDRAKFEAKLRDIRDSGDVVLPVEAPYSAAINSLQKELNAGNINRDEFAEQALQLREKLLDPSRSSRSREEMTDISEVIRAAQDGVVMADYVLQVNELAVEHYSGAPLQLATRSEVQKVLRENPGLRISSSKEEDTIPATLKQPWAQARFNAKLIDIKTGSIDWIGEYSIESLAVLKDGIRIVIGIRKRPSNAKRIIGGIQNYNDTLRAAYQEAATAKKRLDLEYHDALQPKSYYGKSADGDKLQAQRRQSVHRAEEQYAQELSAYRGIVKQEPPELMMEWTYDYNVDEPIVIPDLLHPTKEEESRRLLKHVKDLGSKVTHDLLATIKVSEQVMLE